HRLEQRSAALAAQLHELHDELKQHVASEQAGEQQIAELAQQLRQREEAIATVGLELHREKAGRQSAEQQLSATTRLSEELERHLSLLEQAKTVFAHREAELEAQLQASRETLQANEGTLENETNERRRLEAALETAQREHQRQNDHNAIAVSKLEAAAQVEQLERKRLEAESAQGRFASLDSARLGRAMLNSFRQQMRDSVDTLVQTSR